MPGLAGVLGPVLVVYVAAMLGVGWWARGRVKSSEDFLVAGRRLPLLLAAPTLLATWFGAGTLLTATDEVRSGGLRMAALDPLGAGLCLLLAGLLVARPLWRMKLLTLADFFGRRFGPRAERWSAILMVPTYFGWIAAQFVALAALLQLVFGVDPVVGIAIVAVLGTTFTLLGGMWSVTLLDAVQLALLAFGLVVLSISVLDAVGGWGELVAKTPAAHRVVVPTHSGAAFVGWVGVLAVGALGNLPGQDLTQRVFAARSEKTAMWACYVAGIAYLALGCLPLMLGLAANVLAPDTSGGSTLTALAAVFTTPMMAAIFVVALISAVLSTIDSAILSPASVLSRNLLAPLVKTRLSALALDRLAVLAVAAAALGTAYAGEDAYTLLETAYELGLVTLLVPLLFGVRAKIGGQASALAAMAVGTATWLVHQTLGWESFCAPILAFPLPVGLCAAALAAVTFVGLRRYP